MGLPAHELPEGPPGPPGAFERTVPSERRTPRVSIVWQTHLGAGPSKGLRKGLPFSLISHGPQVAAILKIVGRTGPPAKVFPWRYTSVVMGSPRTYGGAENGGGRRVKRRRPVKGRGQPEKWKHLDSFLGRWGGQEAQRLSVSTSICRSCLPTPPRSSQYCWQE